MPRTWCSQSRLSREGRHGITQPGDLWAPRSLGMQGLTTRKEQPMEAPPIPSHSASGAMWGCPQLHPWQHTQPWHRLRTDTVPPREDKGSWVPICREGRHENNLVGDVQSSYLPLVLSPGGQGQGRQGAVALALLHACRRSGQPRQAGRVVTRTSYGFSTVSPQSYLVALSTRPACPREDSHGSAGRERGGSCSAGSRL